MEKQGIHVSPPVDPSVRPASFQGTLSPKGDSLSSSLRKDDLSSGERVDPATLRESLDKLEDVAKTFGRYLKFEIHEDAKMLQIIVSDVADQDKVIRKIPPDEVVKLVENMNKLIGSIFDREV